MLRRNCPVEDAVSQAQTALFALLSGFSLGRNFPTQWGWLSRSAMRHGAAITATGQAGHSNSLEYTLEVCGFHELDRCSEFCKFATRRTSNLASVMFISDLEQLLSTVESGDATASIIAGKFTDPRSQSLSTVQNATYALSQWS